MDFESDCRNVLWDLGRHRGRERAISMTSLAHLNYMTTRKLRKIIGKLIELGIPIGSASDFPSGYWLLNTAEEYEDADRSLRSRIISLAKRRRALRKHWAGLAGQLELTDD